MPEILVNEALDWQERGLHYGDGLFETLLKKEGVIPFWEDHYQRLYDGCRRLQIVLPEESWIAEKIDRETRGKDTAVVKLMVTRGKGGRGLKLPEKGKPSIYVLTYPYTRLSGKQEGLDVSICKSRLPINPSLAGIKHLNRLDYVLASLELEAKGQFDEGILCDSEGFLVEGIISNLFFCADNQVYTPSLELAGVEGIMRGQILKYFESQGLKLEVGRYTVQMILQANESFMCNSVQGVRPIKSIDKTALKTGLLTRDLMKLFNVML